MKKIAFSLSVITLFFCGLYLKKNNVDTFNVINENNKTTYKQVVSNKKTPKKIGTKKLNVTSPEQYLFEAKKQRRCNSIPKTKDKLDEWLINANEVGEPSEYIEDVLSRFEHCLQHKFKHDNFLAPLIEAIKLGSDNAVEEFWTISEKEFFNSKNLLVRDREEIVTQRAEFNRLKYQFSKNVALTGGEQAILRLIKGYQHYDPDSGNSNYVKAIAFANYGLAITQNNEFYLKLDFIKQRILKGMDTEELQQAQTLTKSLLEKFYNQQN